MPWQYDQLMTVFHANNIHHSIVSISPSASGLSVSKQNKCRRLRYTSPERIMILTV